MTFSRCNRVSLNHPGQHLLADFVDAAQHVIDLAVGICKAMMETAVAPDFIVVDGGEGGTGAAPIEFTDHIGTPLQEALMLVHNTLVGLNLRDQVRIGASGKIITGFDVARTLALGADWCNSAQAKWPSLAPLLSARMAFAESAPKLIAEMFSTEEDPPRVHRLRQGQSGCPPPAGIAGFPAGDAKTLIPTPNCDVIYSMSYLDLKETGPFCSH